MRQCRRYNRIEAQNGIDGLSKHKENPDIVLIITDYYMPKMDGISMCEEIRKYDREIPIFIITTESSEIAKQRGQKAGVRAWICKPIERKSLNKIMESLKL